MLSLLLATLLTQATMSPSSDLSTNRVRATGSTTARALRDRFADVVNVKDFGAKGDGVTDDTVAIRAAITAATGATNTHGVTQPMAIGQDVFFPPGVYLVTDTISLPEGVGIRGAGSYTTQIKVVANASTDGLSWNSGTQYGRGGFLRHISVASPSTTQVRDLVSVVNWGPFDISDVSILGAGRYGLYAPDGIAITVEDTHFSSNVTAGAYVGDTIGSVATTVRFHRTYFSATANGPGADVAGLQINFVDCVFESNGVSTSSTTGDGARVRYGTASFVNPYFENNRGHGLNLGTDVSAYSTSVTVLNPSFQNGPFTDSTKAGVYADRIIGGAIVGGDFSSLAHSIVFTSNSSGVSVWGTKIGPNAPEYDTAGGRTIDSFPGIINYVDSGTGNRRLAGVISEGTIKKIKGTPDTRVTISGTEPDSASAVSVVLDSEYSLTTSGALLLSGRNHGQERYSFDLNGSLKMNGLLSKGVASTPWASSANYSSTGQVWFNNGTSVAPGLHFAYGTNLNFGIDVGGSKMRLVRDLDEAGGSELWTLDTSGTWQSGTAGPMIMTGAFDPEGAATAPIGSIFLRSNGGAGTSFYVKQSGAGFTGWAGK